MKLLHYAILILCVFTISCKTSKKGSYAPKGDSRLMDTYWRLSEMNGKPVINPADAPEVHIRLTEKKRRITGFAGCNRITGTFELGKQGVIAFKAGSTMMYCEGRMDIENHLMQTLTNANRHVINDRHLLLYNDNRLLAVFEAQYFGTPVGLK